MSTSTASPTADREMVLSRVFDAPRDLVYSVWTDPAHLAQWWGPDGFTITTHSLDFQPGGHWRFIMHGPDGRDYQNHIVYVEIAPPERLVYKHVPEKGTEPVSFETTVTFTEQSGKTEVTMRALFPSPAALEHVVKTYGALEGGKQHLGRLGEYVARLAASKS